jgi:hypothetical protein
MATFVAPYVHVTARLEDQLKEVAALVKKRQGEPVRAYRFALPTPVATFPLHQNEEQVAEGLKPDEFLIVRTATGKRIPIACQATDTIEFVKQLLENVTGMPAQDQRLVTRGRQLEDGHTLEHYDVKRGASLTLIGRLAGGMFHASSGRVGLQPSFVLNVDVYVKSAHVLLFLQVCEKTTLEELAVMVTIGTNITSSGVLSAEGCTLYVLDEPLVSLDPSADTLADLGITSQLACQTGKDTIIQVRSLCTS